MRALAQQIRLATGIALMLALVYGMKQPAAVRAAQTVSPPGASAWQPGHTILNPPVKFDHAAPLPQLFAAYHIPPRRHRHRSTSAPVAQPSPTRPQ